MADTDLQPGLPAMLAEERDGLSGQVVSNYRVEKLLSFGDIAWRYRGCDLIDESLVLIEVVDPAAWPESTYAGRFESRLAALAKVHHPSITKIMRFGTSQGGRRYIVLDYLRNVTLVDKLLEIARSRE